MKFWKHSLFTALAFLAISATVLYTSCVKDSCTDLQCRNGGSCADGFCHCPAGYEGAECEIKITDRFLGTYYGTVRCDAFPGLVDTVDVWLQSEPLTLGMVRRGAIWDTSYGTASGNVIVVPDVNENNKAKFVHLTLDDKKITFYVEHVTDVSKGEKHVCSFVGFRP